MSILHSESLSRLAPALLAAQKELKNPAKDAKGQVRGRSDYKYLSLGGLIDDTRETLNKYGIAISQHPNGDGTVARVTTLLLHESGEWIESDAACALVDADPQRLGGVISYLRRYAWQSVIGVCADDDDDAQGVAAHVQQHARPAQKSAPQAAPARPSAPAPTSTPPPRPTTNGADAGGEFIDTTIEMVTKKGERFSVKLGTGVWASTFKQPIADLAARHKGTGEIVRCVVKKNGDFLNLLSVSAVPVSMPADDGPPPGFDDAPPFNEDDLPF